VNIPIDAASLPPFILGNSRKKPKLAHVSGEKAEPDLESALAALGSN